LYEVVNLCKDKTIDFHIIAHITNFNFIKINGK